MGITGAPTELIAQDAAPSRASGVFSALYELRSAPLTNDTQRITSAGAKLTERQQHLAGVQGQGGGRSAAMHDRLTRTEDALNATSTLVSEVTDVDYAEAITKIQQA